MFAQVGLTIQKTLIWEKWLKKKFCNRWEKTK